MTQRIFDVENEKDMADLWDILPESCRKITVGNMWDCVWEDSERFSYRSLFKINWHDKTEITRPIQEVSEADIGKLCKFWDGYNTEVYTIGLLQEIDENDDFGRFKVQTSGWWQHCRRLTADEVKELC